MTGQKDRYSTTEKLWKLDDEQLSTPRHDEIVLNLLTKESVKKVYGQFGVEIVDIDRIGLCTEQPILTSNRFIVGYWDVVYYNQIGPSIYTEVKPTIDSFGKVIRQINTYKTYTNHYNNYIILCTEDTRFKSAFESQGIGVVTLW